MRILGVDPGLGISGYGIIEARGRDFKLLEAGIIKSSPRQDLTQRLSQLYRGLNAIIGQYQPEKLILEKLYSHYKHQMTAIAMAHARGVIALTAGEFKQLELVDYSATRVKKALTGNGNASKLQVQRTIRSILRLKELPNPADVSDALALAIADVYITNLTGVR